MRIGRTGIITKFIVLGLIIYMATNLLDLRGLIQTTSAEKAALESRIAIITRENQRMTEAISNCDDPATMEQAARDAGYVNAGETLYVDIAG